MLARQCLPRRVRRQSTVQRLLRLCCEHRRSSELQHERRSRQRRSRQLQLCGHELQQQPDLRRLPHRGRRDRSSERRPMHGRQAPGKQHVPKRFRVHVRRAHGLQRSGNDLPLRGRQRMLQHHHLPAAERSALARPVRRAGVRAAGAVAAHAGAGSASSRVEPSPPRTRQRKP